MEEAIKKLNEILPDLGLETQLMKFFETNRILIAFLILSIFGNVLIEAKTIHYVKADGTGDGTSWANAAGNIQTMIDKAVSGDEVWVAKGTYGPTTETIPRDARSKTFLLKAGVNIYGGFAGTETSILQRALADLDSDGKTDSCELVNQTILSGDIDGTSDVWTKQQQTKGIWEWAIAGNEGNCYRVVTNSDGSTVLDGFSISGGNANSSANSITDGGGIYLSRDSQIKNCIVSNCSATNGGGICCELTSQTYVINCKVIDCAGKSGGGIYSANYAYSYIINCKVANCTATAEGGGIYVRDDTRYTTNIFYCTIFNCSATSYGGGISIGGTTGGFYCVENCFISNCSASKGGGVECSDNNSSCDASVLKNCTITNCSASTGGGICSYSFDFSIAINSCNISNCLAYSEAGGVYALGGADVVNCALSSNKVGDNLSNTYIERNGLIYDPSGINPNMNDAYIQPTSFCGVATSDAQNLELISANWRLKESSPCINAGTGLIHYDNSVNDLDGNPRNMYGSNDIGAYEYVVPILAMPVREDFNNLTDWSGSSVFYNSAQLNGSQNIKWIIDNQKAVFSWNTNLTTSYSQPFFTYQIDAAKATKVFLRYDMFFQAYAGTITPLGTEKLNVEFSTDLITWTSIASYSNVNGTIANMNYLHDISALAAGKTFYIRFNANGANSNRIEKWEIDNIMISTDAATAVNQIKENKYSYSINNGELTIHYLDEGTAVQIYDMNGKLLNSENAASQTVYYNLPARGVYLVKISTGSEIENKKVVW